MLLLYVRSTVSSHSWLVSVSTQGIWTTLAPSVTLLPSTSRHLPLILLSSLIPGPSCTPTFQIWSVASQPERLVQIRAGDPGLAQVDWTTPAPSYRLNLFTPRIHSV